MEPIIEEFTVTLKYQVTVNPETGEIDTKCINRSINKSGFTVTEVKQTKKSKRVDSGIPELTLEDNKCRFNDSAIELMKLSPDDKIDIKYEKRDKKMIPVIGTDEAFGTKGGNKLTKSLTIACRGSKHDELAKYGDYFTIKPHESKENLFILIGNLMPEDELTGDENINAEDELPIDEGIEEMLNNKEDNNEITNFDFKF